MHHWDYIKEEMESIVSICREHNVISKVIFENCYLEKDEIKQDNIHPPIVVDCTNGDQSTISQRVKQKHVQCKSKTRGRVLQPVQRSRSEKRHSKQKQRRKEEESSHAIEPSQLQICN